MYLRMRVGVEVRRLDKTVVRTHEEFRRELFEWAKFKGRQFNIGPLQKFEVPASQDSKKRRSSRMLAGLTFKKKKVPLPWRSRLSWAGRA